MNNFSALVLQKQTEFINNLDNFQITGVSANDTGAVFNVNGVDITFDWCDNNTICAVNYCNQSQLAMDHVITYMLNDIDNTIVNYFALDFDIDSVTEYYVANIKYKLSTLFNISMEELSHLRIR